ncbi:DUF5353 domain-containing protein [Paenibacillus segetis]|uniref:DUF4190 domain-containing protein n=1 Tax=Paenibacillus segetis TaxID=1325360 RepID=A0ABQ1YHZ3_9BACL|nr:DUF5353 domain-containing protein [Paenibacillus segetis]GGH26573.1 hypothetical protein GCM10008013_27500 [Paenibacillus segetis]
MSDHKHNHSKGSYNPKNFSPAAKSGNKQRTDYPRKSHQEEYSAEVVPREVLRGNNTREERHDRSDDTVDSDVMDSSMGTTVGYIGIGLGILSLFMWSIVLGPIAAIMGFYAYSQDRKTTGAWAMGLGVLATLSYFILIPLMR